jgi:hypothetical protein
MVRRRKQRRIVSSQYAAAYPRVYRVYIAAAAAQRHRNKAPASQESKS